MSSLLIKDMDMPKSCMECICLESIDDEIYGIQHFCGSLGIDAIAKEYSRHKNCNLVEISAPHGRLIDADRLIAVIKSAAGTADTSVPLSAVISSISNAPIIIEEEG